MVFIHKLREKSVQNRPDEGMKRALTGTPGILAPRTIREGCQEFKASLAFGV